MTLIDFFDQSDSGKYYPKHNIVDQISENDLVKIGKCCKEGYDSDKASMEEWEELVKLGLELAKQETEARSEPWDGAANFKSPTLMSACLKFSDRASTELLRPKDIVQINTVGEDPQDEKSQRADRVSMYMNYEINNLMPEWREEHEKLLYDLPYPGTVFKEVYFDAELGRNNSELITYPNFAVDQNCTSVDRLRRFSKILDLPKNIVLEKVNAGLWATPIESEAEVTEGIDFGDSENEGSEEDKVTRFIQQQTYCDLDDDGYEEPYIVVFQESNGSVVRITPRYELSYVKIKLNNKKYSLDQMITAGMSGGQVLRIKPEQNLVKYGFLRDPNGKFLDVGYCHLLSALTAAINATTNQLIDAGTICNLGLVWLAKGFRAKMGNISVKPGEMKQTGLSAQEMKDGILIHPSKEPSQTLLSLMEMMVGSSQELSASADLSKALGTNAPAETTLAMVHEQQLAAGAILQRIYRAMAKEFTYLYNLDGKYLDENEYKEIVDDAKASIQDFNVKNMDISPSANPEISSKIQRIQQASAEIAHIDLVANVGGNPREIVKNYYEAIGSTHINEIFPDLKPEEQLAQLLKTNPQLEAQLMGQIQAKQAADKLIQDRTQAETDHLKARAEAELARSHREDHKTAWEIDEKMATIKDTLADSMLKEAQAEVAATKSHIDVHKAVQEIDSMFLDNQLQAVQLNQPQELTDGPQGMAGTTPNTGAA